ncbi:PP2C family protein-serine/threonine phosphatase [candidate division KSB1 bacterium]
MPSSSGKRGENIKDQKIGRTIRQDFKDMGGGTFKRTILHEFKDIYYFYVDEETRKRLSRMGKFKRWFMMSFNVLKSMFLKLTPFRRLLLLVSIALAMSNTSYQGEDIQVTVSLPSIGYAILLFVLILELKDKLLAQDELAAGRVVQKSMIPDRNPELTGWEIYLNSFPANEVGGDLVDYIELDKDTLGIVIADVAGKGLGAALYMVKMQSTFRAIAHSFRSLTDFGMRINEIFCRDGVPTRFISLLYLTLTSKSDTVQYLNAGHLPPLVMRRGAVSELPQGDTAIGLTADTVFNEKQAVLNSGDMMLIYSDGITEARDKEGQFFGDNRLQGLFLRMADKSPAEVGKRLVKEVNTFIGDEGMSDDISFIIIKRR